jgi:hypothetical protein
MSEFANDPSYRRLGMEHSDNRITEAVKEIGDFISLGLVTVVELPSHIESIRDRLKSAANIGATALHLRQP